MELLEDRFHILAQDEVVVVQYDPKWPSLFLQEKEHLLSCLPGELIGRIEHFGSTSVPGLASKPIIDMLVEVTDLEETRRRIVPILESQRYEYRWRPTWGGNIPPFYAWFIKRDSNGNRTHQIHMIEPHFEHWDRLLFRDYLIEHPDVAEEYRLLKIRLAVAFPRDRVAYAEGKTEFIVRVTEEAKRLYGRAEPVAGRDNETS
ncbi:MAG: GrpB family protein [Desulfomonilaceae bacterium]